MEMIEAYFPALSLKVGVGVAAVVWMCALIDGHNAGVILPNIKTGADCGTKLQIIKGDTMPLPASVTMVTTRNSVISRNDIYVNCSNYFQINWNDTKASNGDAFVEDDFSITIFPANGDPLALLSGYGTVFLIMTIPNDVIYVCVHALYDDTSLLIYNNSVALTSYNISALEQICLKPNETVDGIVLNSTKYIQVLTGNDDQLIDGESESNMCNISADNVWETIPSFDSRGSEYFIAVPDQAKDVQLVVSGMEDGELRVITDSNTTNITIRAFESLLLNISNSQYAKVSSSIPIQVMCVMLIPGQNGIYYKNLFFLDPIVSYTECSWFIIQNCDTLPCIMAVSLKSIDNISMSIKSGSTNESHSLVMKFNDIYPIWEIGNLSDGVYQLSTDKVKVPVIVYYLDSENGWFMPVVKTSNSTCSLDNDKPSCFDSNDELYNNSSFTGTMQENTYMNGTEDSVTVSSQGYQSTMNTTSNLSTENFTQSSSIVTEQSTNSSIDMNVTETAKQNVSELQNDTSSVVTYNGSDGTNLSQSSPIQLENSNLGFLYEEIPEDDTIVREYMIAVIVSLCVAIFAVIAVIVTFLFLELISRRKQLRNTKIRPFVS